ncbi:hypothetical protein J5N97_006479 [Dioscorea zingiberensis]|uniref:Exopolygalacturonase n=1 Tax=Dioscorea zingiberensis TaxID=325984 RepID=A0A9D5DA81_9LILI|nr:hypothetical protein J5N97_006479 [Dioscorea zingiberensis]
MKKLLMSFFLSTILCLFFIADNANAGRVARSSSGNNFNVLSFGAKADGRTDNTKAFLDAWRAACGAAGSVKLIVPPGTYFLGPVRFIGPCKNVKTLTMQMQGTLKASTDLKRYPSDVWVQFGWLDGLILTGGGTFDGQGALAWPFNKCPKQKKCKLLPINIKFVNTKNTVVNGITSVNSKFFHIALLHCHNFQGRNIKIIAPANSPNTDGIHIERNSGVSITQSNIGTGDDCISIGQGNSDVTLQGIKCGPGHGISVGSLGRYKNEGDVRNLVVKDCTIRGTDNGVRIKTWENSPSVSSVANMTFENIVMDRVANPIIIDQTYCPFAKCDTSVPSRVRISDITFRNIRGTSTSPVAVLLDCSKGVPCKNIRMHDVHLNYVGGLAGVQTTSTCQNVRAAYSGKQVPKPCH